MTPYQRAKQFIPGGVNSPVRAFNGVGGDPIFMARGEGPFLFDIHGTRYIDYVASWGPLILGHAHPRIVEALEIAIRNGLSFGAPTTLEVEMAEMICQRLPSIDKVRMVNSGTEATMTALRLARGFTGRHKILKFNGCYHGHHDPLLVKAGSGVLTLGLAGSSGVPPHVAADVLVANYNHCEDVEMIFKAYGHEIAAVIVEPIAGNMNCVLPKPEFLPFLREITQRYDSVLIFDEVITGFRVGPKGAQGLYGITPDLTTLGKIIGGGMPVGAVGGKHAIMDLLAPLGPVYQAGTLSGNPIALTAGITTLKILSDSNLYVRMEQLTNQFVAGLNKLASESGIPFHAYHMGSMFGLFFTDQPISSYEDVVASDINRFKAFFHEMLKAGIYLAPSAFEAGFISAVHETSHIETTLNAAYDALNASPSR